MSVSFLLILLAVNAKKIKDIQWKTSPDRPPESFSWEPRVGYAKSAHTTISLLEDLPEVFFGEHHQSSRIGEPRPYRASWGNGGGSGVVLVGLLILRWVSLSDDFLSSILFWVFWGFDVLTSPGLFSLSERTDLFLSSSSPSEDFLFLSHRQRHPFHQNPIRRTVHPIRCIPEE